MKHNTWLVDSDVPDANIGFRAIVDSNGFTVCRPSPMGEDNAKVISAAPETLAALETFVRFFDEMPKGQLGKIVCDIGLLNSALCASRAAIAKAKG